MMPPSCLPNVCLSPWRCTTHTALLTARLCGPLLEDLQILLFRWQLFCRHRLHPGRSALKNPYNRGFLRNWGQVFFQRTPARLPEPLLTGEAAPNLGGPGVPGEMLLLQDTLEVHGGLCFAAKGCALAATST